MSDKILDAWFSADSVRAGCGWSIYSDVDGNQFAITEVVVPGTKPTSKWGDLVYLGQVVRWIESRNDRTVPNNLRTIPNNLLSPLTGGRDALKFAVKAKVPAQSTKAINDYVCPACHNEKCSRTEKSCWKCGFRFSNG